jgi:hypothetical protein
MYYVLFLLSVLLQKKIIDWKVKCTVLFTKPCTVSIKIVLFSKIFAPQAKCTVLLIVEYLLTVSSISINSILEASA